MVKMGKLIAGITVMLLVLCRISSAQITKINTVTTAGSVIYGEGYFSMNGAMPGVNHDLTITSRIYSLKTGRTTGWRTQTKHLSQPNRFRIQMSFSETDLGDYRFEAVYDLYCPRAGANNLTSNTPRVTLFSVGYSFNCYQIQPGTNSLWFDSKTGLFKWIGDYWPVSNCFPSCGVGKNIIFETPEAKGKADEYVNIKYYWLKLATGGGWCLYYKETGRSPCAGCYDKTTFP